MLEKIGEYKTVLVQYHAGLTSFYALCCELVKLLLGEIRILTIDQLQPAVQVIKSMSAPSTNISPSMLPATPSAPICSLYEHFKDPKYWHHIENLQKTQSESHSAPSLSQMDPIPPIFCAAMLLLIRFLIAKGPRIVRNFFKVRTALGPKIVEFPGEDAPQQRSSMDSTKWLGDDAHIEETSPLDYLDCI